MKPPTELPEQNVEAYMAGYLLAKSKIGTCNTCKKQCQYDKPPDTDQYIFLKKKAYQIENTLVYPTEAFIEFAENLEILFLHVFDTVKFLDGILERLMTNVKDVQKDFLECQNTNCQIKLHEMIKLYFKVKMFYALKISNRENKNKKGVKRNRKLMKLKHV